jgi:hypothetical protein
MPGAMQWMSGPERSWMRRSECVRRGINPDDFYKLSDPNKRAEYRAMCEGCPVLAACREYVDQIEHGLDQRRIHGFWAGETAKERYRRRNPGDETAGPVAPP